MYINLKFLFNFLLEIISSKLRPVKDVSFLCLNFPFLSEDELPIVLIFSYGFFVSSKLFFSVPYYAVEHILSGMYFFFCFCNTLE
jgi:hypothetical protein